MVTAVRQTTVDLDRELKRWTPLKPHPIQSAYFRSQAKRVVCPSGRRSGKTEIAMRRMILEAGRCRHEDGWLVAAGPTWKQAKQIFWEPLKALVPRSWRAARPSESDLSIKLKWGPRIGVVGLDVPQRIEGKALDWIVLDEYGSMRAEAWTEHVQPALATVGREGTAWFIGVPEGRNHYWELWRPGEGRDRVAEEDADGWSFFKWPSADVLSPEAIERARHEMDERTFRQEYYGDFADFQGRAYYGFDREVNGARALTFEHQRDLIFCFDFNKAPGVAAVVQEQAPGTCVIGEEWKERDSNTEIICRWLVKRWKPMMDEAWRDGYDTRVKCYGDATGGAGGSSSVRGSDWEIVRDVLRAPDAFGDRCLMLHGRENPRVAVRVNSMNRRLRDANGKAHLFVDAAAAPHVIQDLEGVTWEDLAKKRTFKPGDERFMLTHISDGLGYYVESQFSSGGPRVFAA